MASRNAGRKNSHDSNQPVRRGRDPRDSYAKVDEESVRSSNRETEPVLEPEEDRRSNQDKYDYEYGGEAARSHHEDEHSDNDRARDEEEEEEEEEDYDDYSQGHTRRRFKDEELDTYAHLLTKQMAESKIHDGFKKHDIELIKMGIEDYRKYGLARDRRLIDAEKVVNYYETCKRLLRKARRAEQPDVEELKQELKRAKDYKVEPFLRLEVERTRDLYDKLREPTPPAEDEIEEKKRTNKHPINAPHILAMDKKTLTEIKSYAKPAPVVHRIMVAALLLLGEDEETTMKWQNIQKICNPNSDKINNKEGLLKRLNNFEEEDVHPEVKDRVKFLLKNITLSQAQKASPGAATFYVWAKSVVGEEEEEEESDNRENEANDHENESAVSASADRRDDDEFIDIADDISVIDDRYKYEELEKEKERAEKDRKEYIRTLPKVILREKQIFEEQKRERQARMEAMEAERKRSTARTRASKAPQSDQPKYNYNSTQKKNVGLRYL